MIFPALISLFGAYLLMDYKKTYAGGGSTLLAPNGKPSNLTPEQWKLVRTPEFKAWFGDWENDSENASKVVDGNGEPLVLTHSTKKLQKEDGTYEDYFNIDNWLEEKGNYIFSTPNSVVNPIFLSRKGEYAKYDEVWQIKFFANIRKLFDTDNKKDLKKLKEYTIKKYSKYGEFNNMVEDLYGGGYEIFEVDYKIGKKKNKYDNKGSIPAIISEMGYGAYINKDENVIVIFDRNNIKLADGSNTTFDTDNPDIRYDEGGDTRIYYDNAYYARPLSDLIKFAKKFNDFKEFENWYSIGLNHGYYWHLTDNKNFQISDKISPRDMSSMSSSNNTSNFGDLMITGDLEYWDNYYNINPKTGKKDIKRKYVVLFDATELNPKSLKQVSRGFGNEIYLNKEDAKKLKIKGVYSRHHAKHLNNRFQEILPQSEQDLYKLWEYAHKKKNDWTEFYEDLKIEDGSKYIGMKFYEIFPFLKRSRSTPYTFKLWVKSYKGILSRLENDKYSVKKEKQRDLNKINKYPYNNIDIMEKWKYLSNFYLDATGTIMSYKDEKL